MRWKRAVRIGRHAVVLALFAMSTIALDLHTVIRAVRDERNGATQRPLLRLVAGGSGPNRPRGGDDVSQSAA